MHPSMSLELVVGGRVILGFITDLLGNKLIVQSNYDLSGGLKREITTLYSYLFIHCVQLSGQWLILVPVVQNTMWVTIEPTCKGSVSVRCWSSTDSLTPTHLSVRLTSLCCRAHRERKRAQNCAIWLLCYVLESSTTSQNNFKKPPAHRHAAVSQLHVKQCRVPLKTSDKKPIWSPSSNHQFLLQEQPLHFCLSECYSSTGGKKLEDKAETGEMWQFNAGFHGDGETGAKGVVVGLLGASKRRIKMVGYRRALHFFFVYFFCPFLISCKFELLSRPFKLATLLSDYASVHPAAARAFCALNHRRWSL